MDLSVCILTRNLPILLSQCVESCIREIERAGLSGEIIIVDNASSDRYPEKLAATTPMVQVIRSEEHLVFGVAQNRAVKASHGEYILLFNDDAILQEGSLALMLSALKSDPRTAATGPTLVFPDGSPQVLYMNKRLPSVRGMFAEFTGRDLAWRHKRLARKWLTMWDSPEHAAEPEQLSGACFLIRREAWDAMGGFDEQFRWVLDDTDLCFRLRKAGWRFRCVEAARVTHYGGLTHARRDRLEQQLDYYKCIYGYFRKHSSFPKYLLARVVLGVAVVFIFVEQTFWGTWRLAKSRRNVSLSELARKIRGRLALLWSLLRAGTTRAPEPSRH